jgi:protoheme IX farnesyltransferase
MKPSALPPWTSAGWSARRLPWRAYLEVTKPRVVALMLFTVVVGMLLARAASVPWPLLVFGTLGIGLMAACGAAINHLVDQHADALMARTRARPLPRGVLGSREVGCFAALLGLAGLALLQSVTNTLCVLLTFGSMVGYAGVYSLWLKRATPQNIVIGGAAGAAPPLLGWVAVTGQVEPGALLLFATILVWTPPHFWALAIHRREDYRRAEIPMLPVTHGIAFTATRILQYSVVLLGVTVLPVAIGMSGWLYLAGAVALGAGFVGFAWRLRRDSRWAMPTFKYSIAYLFVLFALLLADRAVAPLLY